MSLTKLVTCLSALTMSAFLSTAAMAHGGEGDDVEVDYANVEEHPFGKASNPTAAVQTIEVEMSDMMRFSPAEITVKKGDTVRFFVKNGGQLQHEMVLGTLSSLAEHAELMKKFPGMEHEEPHMAHVSSNHTKEMGWQFTEAGEFFYGCLVPGHFDAGISDW